MVRTGVFEIWPAIDLRGGKCVRLRQGDYAQETIFDDDPASVARRWQAAGAQHIHLVDLDGARDGRLVNGEAIAAIVAAVTIPCQLGGGVRHETTIRELLSLGLSRLVVGTQALRQPDWFRGMCRAFPRQLALGIDARGGRVATAGWLEVSDTPAIELVRQFADEPIGAVIYTDIARDGMLAGPNLEAMAEMCEATEFPVLASGGVTEADDVRQLARRGLAGCIIGRALYEGRLSLAEALTASTDFSSNSSSLS